ncbi:MAG: ribulose-phosphate 3-epimerase [Candidatus Paceibacteria bacterium]
MSKIEVIPAIMPESLEDLNEKHSLVKEYVSTVQVDVMDGNFVQSVDWPYTNAPQGLASGNSRGQALGNLPKIDFDFEVDLMISNPEDFIEAWVNAGAKRIIIHIESVERIEDVFLKIPSGVETGIALNTTTENKKIYPLIEKIDFVQFMGIEKIGFQGQSFDERVLGKIADLREKFPRVIISVDGGVSLETAVKLKEAGANRLVSGSAIFKSGNIKESIEKLKNSRSQTSTNV